ncbi:hypothetical protein [Nocardioides sp.]|uniref:hypothetical protein n=1 Tax=Nocardioides sp. TaxID=35761 RepID=UPI0035B15C97
MDDDWVFSDEEDEALLAEWRAVDRAAADYLEERVPGLTDPIGDDESRWLDALVETFDPADEPDIDPELFSSVMALQHADWLGLALGTLARGPGSTLDASRVLDDIDGLDDVEGEIEDREGTRQVLSTAFLVLTPAWQDLGVLDDVACFTDRGVWGLPRALHRSWSR